MSILISPTLANESTPYYALASAVGGGVTQVVAGSNITLSPSGGTGAVTVTAAAVPAVVALPAFLTGDFGVAPYPTSPAAGQVAGQDYVAPRTGIYLLQVSATFNVNPAAVVAPAGDILNIALVTSVPSFTVTRLGSVIPASMPSSGSDYFLRTSFLASLTAGQTYSLAWYINNTSGTMDLGDSNGGVSMSLVPLC